MIENDKENARFEIEFRRGDKDYELRIKDNFVNPPFSSLILTPDILYQLNKELMLNQQELMLENEEELFETLLSSYSLRHSSPPIYFNFKETEDSIEVELSMKYQTPLGKTINRASNLLFPTLTSSNQSNLLEENQLLKEQNRALKQDLHHHNLHSNSLSIQISNYQQEISSLINQSSEKDLIISSLNSQISEKDLKINSLLNKIMENDQLISMLSNQIPETDLNIKSLVDNIKDKEEEISQIKKEVDQEKEEKDNLMGKLNLSELYLKEKDEKMEVLKSMAIPSLVPNCLSLPYLFFSPQFSSLSQSKFLIPSTSKKIIPNEENDNSICDEKAETNDTKVISASDPLCFKISPPLSFSPSPSTILSLEDKLTNDFNHIEINNQALLNQNNKEEKNFDREMEKIKMKRYTDTHDLHYKVKWKDQEEERWERAEDLLPFHSSLVTRFEKSFEKENGNPSFHTILASRTNLTTGEEEFKVKWYNPSSSPSWVPSHLLLISPSLISPSLPKHDFEEKIKPMSSLFPSPFKKDRIKEIRNRISEKEFELQWNIVRYFKPYGPGNWNNFLSTDPVHFSSCNTIHHSNRFLRSILPADSLLYTIKKEEIKGKGFRPPHLECRSDHSSIQYECVIGFVEGHLVVELEKGRRRMGCRMWRKWGSHRFLYVSFRPNVPVSVISTICEEGLTLHPLPFSYHFLFSKPMEKQVIFFMENGSPHISAHSIREWAIEVGRNSEMNVCKYNARLSLSFSPSIPVAVIPLEETAVIEDKYGREGEEESIMTDGCSFISFSSLLTIKTQARLTHTPSVVQGRYANSKGVWIMGDSNQMGSSALLRRRSQIKYSLPTPLSDDHLQTFDLLHYSREMGAARLNRQYIQVLEHLGIPSQIFLDLQHDAISQLLLYLTSSPEMALREVKGGKEGEGIENEVKEYLLAGFDFQEPYLRNSILSLLMHRLKKIKEKASIKVEMSRYLLMVPDPTGKLQEGEVFIQISGEENGIKVINSSVIVTRTPCHLPSDVRVMLAVDIVELRNMVDCIVFSTIGSSSPASMMSGGDYDGDLAWVCWDPRLLSYSISPPPLPLPLSLDPAISADPASLISVGEAVGWGSSNYLNVRRLEKLLVDHFLLHSKSKLGELTVLHSRWAEGNGIDHPTTIRLAQLCALAVDSAKSGVIITLPSLPDTPPYPHYLKSSLPSFHSTSALGKLYDDIQPDGIIARIGKWWKDKKKSGPSSPLLLDPDLILSTIPPRYLSLADKWMKEYNKEISLIMKNSSDPIKKLKCEQLQEIMREKYLSSCSSVPESLLLASAIYKVTRSRDIDLKQAARNFPWMICADRLIRLKSDAVNKRLDNHLAPTILSRFYSSTRFG